MSHAELESRPAAPEPPPADDAPTAAATREGATRPAGEDDVWAVVVVHGVGATWPGNTVDALTKNLVGAKVMVPVDPPEVRLLSPSEPHLPPREQLQEEWGHSMRVLSEIIGQAVTTASIPGGNYSAKVAQSASEAGIRFLFSSEPTQTPWRVANCLVLGRYSIQRNTAAETAARIAAGDSGPRIAQFIHWNAKKLLKSLSGSGYLKLRERLLRH